MMNARHIYQVYTGRLESANLIKHEGTVLKKMQRLKWGNLRYLGISDVYLLGVFDSRGPVIITREEEKDLSNQPDRVPSCFAITDHLGVNPYLGSNDDLITLIDIIHNQGLKVILDLVPNQTGLNHEWVHTRPEYYLHNEQGMISGFSGDVVMLDHGNQQVGRELINITLNAASWGADGVRCDMAHLVPEDLWRKLIKQVKTKYPGFCFIAEAYGDSVFDWRSLERLLEVGFDTVYHEYFYRHLKQDRLNEARIDYLASHINYAVKNKDLSRYVSYISNHDDGVRLPRRLVPALWCLMRLMNGSTMTYNGSLNGRLSRLAQHWIEILPDHQLEINSSPIWALDIVRLLDEYRLRITETDSDQTLIDLKLNSIGKQMIWQANLGEEDKEITGKGTVIYCYGNGKRLGPGDWLLMGMDASA